MHHHEEESRGCPAAPVVLNQDSECVVYGYADSPGTLRLTERSALLYLYRPSELEKDLKDRTASELLRCAGYPCPNCGACLCYLLKRFQNGEEFPHEIGLFLSYPPEDVKGFLTDRDNYKSICLWKIYGDEDKAKRLCARYKQCTECYCRMWKNGRRLEQLAVAS